MTLFLPNAKTSKDLAVDNAWVYEPGGSSKTKKYMVYTPMGSSPTIIVVVYSHFGGSPKLIQNIRW